MFWTAWEWLLICYRFLSRNQFLKTDDTNELGKFNLDIIMISDADMQSENQLKIKMNLVNSKKTMGIKTCRICRTC